MSTRAVPTQDHIWEQGEDLIVQISYEINSVPVELDKEIFAVRMDIAPKTPAAPAIYSFNSDDFDGALDEAGDDDNEVAFPAESPGLVNIKVPRKLTLPGGVIGDNLETTKVFVYDLFLRDKARNTQTKLLKGSITVNPSVTLWA